jgi:hypothetical protein
MKPLNFLSNLPHQPKANGGKLTKSHSSTPLSTENFSAQIQQSILDQTIAQRQVYKAMETAAPDPVQSHAKQKGELLERRIVQLQQKSD